VPAGVEALITDTTLKIVVADRAEVRQTATRWLEWYDSLFSEPVQESDDAWNPPRMEYALTVAGQLSEDKFDQRPLTASEFYDGPSRLEQLRSRLRSEPGHGARSQVRRDHRDDDPAPVVFRGAPAPRYWELEDARIEYGLMPVGPNRPRAALMIEYASSYGNDWFVVPLTLAGRLAHGSQLARRHRQFWCALAVASDRRSHLAGGELEHVPARAHPASGQRGTWEARVEPVLPAAGARPQSAKPGGRRRVVHA
jgi:hypothetical protein